MLSLSSPYSRTARISGCARALRRAASFASVLALLGAIACSSSDDKAVPLADSGSITSLVDDTTPLAIPTTVALRDGIAWVAESQLDQLATSMPGNFRVVGLPLAGGSAQYINLPAGFFPEGITVSPSGYLFVGSVRTGSVYAVPPNVTLAGEFLAPKAAIQAGAFGMTVSPDGKTLWVCDSDQTAKTARVRGIDISTKQLVATHELKPADPAEGSFCNDLLLSPNGSLWVTESFGGRLFVIPSDKLMTDGDAPVWLKSDTLKGNPAATNFGVNGLALLGDKLYLDVTDPGLIYNIDPSLKDPTDSDLRRVILSDPSTGKNNIALSNPDGMTRLSATELLVVENGLNEPGGKRVIRLALDPR